MARAPIVPGNLSDPGNFDRLERRAIKDFTRRIKAAGDAYLAIVDSIEFESFETNRAGFTYELIVDPHVIPAPDAKPQFRCVPTLETNARRYTFRTLTQTIAQALEAAGRLVDRLLVGADARTNWFSLEYVIPSFEQGTAQSWRNLGVQSATYAATRPTLADLITSEPYQRRLSLLQTREFELMKGLSGTVKQQLAETLTGGLAQGIGPKEIAKNIKAQTGVEIRRAERIARTEIGMALRTARLDEAQDAASRLGSKIRIMHLSALSPTTRLTHAQRHGHLYDIEVERDWFAAGSNSINCKCSMTEVLVDDKGQPLSKGLVDRTQAAGKRYLEAQNAE